MALDTSKQTDIYRVTHSIVNLQPSDLQATSADLVNRNLFSNIKTFVDLVYLELRLDVTTFGSPASPRFRIYTKDIISGKYFSGELIKIFNEDGTEFVFPAGANTSKRTAFIYVGNEEFGLALENCQTGINIDVIAKRVPR
jgi:hypothetical protein